MTWAFEFEDQPYFDGFRDLATNGIDKPVLNVFRMFGMMDGQKLAVKSSGALDLDALLKAGVKGEPDVNAVATRGDRVISVMAWNYHDDDVTGAVAPIALRVAGVPATAPRVLVRHYRIDKDHSNAYTVWQAMGSPQSPTPSQYAQLEAAGHLQSLGSPEFVAVKGGFVDLAFSLPRQAVSLIQVSW